ncbi:MAG: HNH endonuclease [Desulfurellales bacterium]|nr:MAG: HNH endonuclease [Desulfurellales bacterium]
MLCTECGTKPRRKNGTNVDGTLRYKALCRACHKKKYEKTHAQTKKPHCERCGFLAKDPRQLDVHHIDGNHSNDCVDNLMTLCANCHRLEHAP